MSPKQSDTDGLGRGGCQSLGSDVSVHLRGSEGQDSRQSQDRGKAWALEGAGLP